MWWRIPLRVAGGLVLALAIGEALLLSSFVRLEGVGDLEAVVRNDVLTGTAIAFGVALAGVPPVGKATARRFALVALAGLAVGVVVGGGLVWSHFEQLRIRSTPG